MSCYFVIFPDSNQDLSAQERGVIEDAIRGAILELRQNQLPESNGAVGAVIHHHPYIPPQRSERFNETPSRPPFATHNRHVQSCSDPASSLPFRSQNLEPARNANLFSHTGIVPYLGTRQPAPLANGPRLFPPSNRPATVGTFNCERLKIADTKEKPFNRKMFLLDKASATELSSENRDRLESTGFVLDHRKLDRGWSNQALKHKTYESTSKVLCPKALKLCLLDSMENPSNHLISMKKRLMVPS